MRVRTCFKISFKKDWLNSVMKSMAIQYKKISMYPFYYPFAAPFCYTQLPPYPYDFDVNNVNYHFAAAQQFILEEKQVKVEEVNTSYSVNGSAPQQKQIPQTSISSAMQPDFQQPKEKYFKPQKKKEDEGNYKQKKGNKFQTQRLRYVNKNFESNIINKIFSFLWSEQKSKSYVDQILKDRTKVMLYFEYIKIVRKYSKRYINKEYLQNLCNYQPHHIAFRIVARNVEKLNYFSMEELSKTMRKLIFIFLKKVCTLSILTSKKMVSDIWKDHFEKARNIYQFIFQGLSSEDYDVRMCHSYESIYDGDKAEQKD